MESQSGGGGCPDRRAKRFTDGKLEGRLEGKQEGKLEGKLEGESLALQRLLVRRFGPIPPDMLEQIAAANLEQIETWFDAAINAPHLAAVFTPTSN
ncbi:MAG: DUF4351 domain-containing protein [Candidatus Accumulibacter sp.]|nr:DUF4351 domain-containing protein [Accumulibacter sp.]